MAPTLADAIVGLRLAATEDDPERPIDDRLLQALTTEHAALQAARGSTIFEATGRATLYLAAVSSAVVALAFIGQSSRIGQPFFLFALAVLPALFFLGIVTYLRLLASAVEDMVCARAINRSRHYYLELDPAAARYLLLSAHDDTVGVFANAGLVPPRWHLLSHTASLIVVIDAFVGGVFAALIVDAAFDPSVGVSAGLGVIVTLAAAAGGMWHQRRQWRAAEEATPVAFPSPRRPMPGDFAEPAPPLASSGRPRRGVGSKRRRSWTVRWGDDDPRPLRPQEGRHAHERRMGAVGYQGAPAVATQRGGGGRATRSGLRGRRLRPRYQGLAHQPGLRPRHRHLGRAVVPA